MSKNTNTFFNTDNMTSGYMKQLEDLGSMSKLSSEALSQSAAIFTKGAEDIMKTCMSKAQNSSEKSANVWKSLMACKTISEVAETQSRLAQESFEDVMNTTSQISEMSAKMAMDCLEPLNKQMSDTVKKAQNSMAA